jgi:predicted ATPase
MAQTAAHSLFGRKRDVAALGAFVEDAGEHGGAILVTGDAGVGKTALVNAVAAHARQRGVRVLRGGCPDRRGTSAAIRWG